MCIQAVVLALQQIRLAWMAVFLDMRIITQFGACWIVLAHVTNVHSSLVRVVVKVKLGVVSAVRHSAHRADNVEVALQMISILELFAALSMLAHVRILAAVLLVGLFRTVAEKLAWAQMRMCLQLVVVGIVELGAECAIRTVRAEMALATASLSSWAAKSLIANWRVQKIFVMLLACVHAFLPRLAAWRVNVIAQMFNYLVLATGAAVRTRRRVTPQHQMRFRLIIALVMHRAHWAVHELGGVSTIIQLITCSTEIAQLDARLSECESTKINWWQ